MSQLDLEQFPGRIVEIERLEDVQEAIDYLLRFQYIGFDTETRPAFKKGSSYGVALAQLATDDICFLFRLSKIGFPPALIGLLSNPKVMKIGLSLKDDFQSMGRRMRFVPQGFVELQKFIKNYDIEDISLQKIYALLFGKRISKSQQVSNWEAEELSDAQKRYAALDAWACLKIYKKLCTKEFI
ncbi:3'-5' exonuclease [Bacteroidia bacterium]|nr:3'-5' exonuclease [Bacteroidia bacterium]